ncbi:MAG: hypothetical protein PVH58_19835 [Desulfobacterales bacterium]|jgi:hypothetical protein
MDSQNVMVEIVAKKKGCMLCDLALAILEEITPEFEKGVLQWEVVDVSSREGVMRHAELGAICKRMPAVPSIVINERIAFDNIPDMEALSAAVRESIVPQK